MKQQELFQRLWRVWGPLCLVGLVLTGACQPLSPSARPSPAKTASFSRSSPVALPANKLGLHLLLADGRRDWPVERWPDHLNYARQAVGPGGFVVQLVRLDDLDPVRWQRFMDLCIELELTPILRLATRLDPDSGGWIEPPRDPDGTYRQVAARYARFIAALTWPAGPRYIIVGNEPNHGSEWGGRPDPAGYARFLIDVADTLHAVDPQVQILNAGFDAYAPHTGSLPFNDGWYYMDEETFLDQMVAAEPDVFTRLDLWASHSYPPGPFSQGPWRQSYQVDWLNDAANPAHVEPPPGVYNRGVNGYEWELFKLATYGLPPLPVLITETGWRHAETTDPASPDNGRPLPEAEIVARYVDLALSGNRGRYPDLPMAGWTPWLADPRVVGVVFFALDGHPAFWGHTNWLALDQTGAVLDVYAPFEKLIELQPNEGSQK